MKNISILGYLAKCITDSSIITLLTQIFEILTSDRYKKILKKDPELDYLVQTLTEKFNN